MSHHKEKIFCLGFSKTGTTSMEHALEILDYKVCRGYWGNNYTFYLLALSVNKDYDELLRMTEYWDAFADGPWGGTDLYIKLLEKYPHADYILTEREPESWYNSFEKLITMFDLNLDTALASYHTNGMWGSGHYFESLFDIKTLAGNKQKIIDAYIKYNNDVKAYFQINQKKLLVLDLSKTNGWDVICPFLNCAIPDTAFPHQNKSVDNPYLSNLPLIDSNNTDSNLLQIDTSISSVNLNKNSIIYLVKKFFPLKLRRKIRAFMNT